MTDLTSYHHGVRVVELAHVAAGPFAGMLLADLGADVVRVQRAGSLPAEGRAADQLLRGRSAVVEADLVVTLAGFAPVATSFTESS